eukprot:TRINITY_DN20139_c0_g1_i1.p1 TRINITY_DN20139_c0_g1~~TRINITY_DN20139_c0_g1_i1.p1  ORF type:complete len:860 (-),score=193.98 TRINITY_DN20139_c0_g1_i1:80-2659(-)
MDPIRQVSLQNPNLLQNSNPSLNLNLNQSPLALLTEAHALSIGNGLKRILLSLPQEPIPDEEIKVCFNSQSNHTPLNYRRIEPSLVSLDVMENHQIPETLLVKRKIVKVLPTYHLKLYNLPRSLSLDQIEKTLKNCLGEDYWFCLDNYEEDRIDIFFNKADNRREFYDWVEKQCIHILGNPIRLNAEKKIEKLKEEGKLSPETKLGTSRNAPLDSAINLFHSMYTPPQVPSPKIFQISHNLAVPKAARAFSPVPPKMNIEPPEERRGTKRKVPHNPTRMIEIINSTKGRNPHETGVLWIIKEHEEKKIPIQFIAINWSKFYSFYKKDQSQPQILDRTIREKFQPSKCKRDRKDPNSESEWREIDKNAIGEFDLAPPQGQYDAVYTYVPWWTDNELEPPQAKKKRPHSSSNSLSEGLSSIKSTPTNIIPPTKEEPKPKSISIPPPIPTMPYYPPLLSFPTTLPMPPVNILSFPQMPNQKVSSPPTPIALPYYPFSKSFPTPMVPNGVPAFQTSNFIPYSGMPTPPEPSSPRSRTVYSLLWKDFSLYKELEKMLETYPNGPPILKVTLPEGGMIDEEDDKKKILKEIKVEKNLLLEKLVKQEKDVKKEEGKVVGDEMQEASCIYLSKGSLLSFLSKESQLREEVIDKLLDCAHEDYVPLLDLSTFMARFGPLNSLKIKIEFFCSQKPGGWYHGNANDTETHEKLKDALKHDPQKYHYLIRNIPYEKYQTLRPSSNQLLPLYYISLIQPSGEIKHFQLYTLPNHQLYLYLEGTNESDSDTDTETIPNSEKESLSEKSQPEPCWKPITTGELKTAIDILTTHLKITPDNFLPLPNPVLLSAFEKDITKTPKALVQRTSELQNI